MIIPVYNCEAYVAAAIGSVLAQTVKIDELIIVDDGSVDDSLAAIRQFQPFAKIITQAHAGPAAALNNGLRTATGDLITFLDSDDLWLPEKTHLQLQALSADSSLDAVFGNVRQFVSPGTSRERQFEPQSGFYRCGMMIRRPAFDRVGPFDESMRIIDFLEWFGRAKVLDLKWSRIEELVVLRRLHGKNTGVIHRREQADENLLVLKRLIDSRRGGVKKARE